VSRRPAGGPAGTEWYYVAEPESDKAVQAVRALLAGTDAQVDAVRPLAVVLLNGKELKPGQVKHVYRRGTQPARNSRT
jgi:hypothetical protein